MTMKKAISLLLVLCLAAALFMGCKGKAGEEAPAPKNENVAADGETFVFPENETDYAALRTPGSQEAKYTYKNFFLPAQDNGAQPFVGDTSCPPRTTGPSPSWGTPCPTMRTAPTTSTI